MCMERPQTKSVSSSLENTSTKRCTHPTPCEVLQGRSQIHTMKRLEELAENEGTVHETDVPFV